jgi:hypothetical protein
LAWDESRIILEMRFSRLAAGEACCTRQPVSAEEIAADHDADAACKRDEFISETADFAQI